MNPPAKALPSKNSPAVTVLLVEDCDGDALVLRRMMRKAKASLNLHIVEVSRLAEAFVHLRREKFDIIFLDVNLPDLNGPIVISAMHEEVPATPIIVYSGMADEKFQERALAAGAAHYLVKGYESPEAVRRLFVAAEMLRRAHNPLCH